MAKLQNTTWGASVAGVVLLVAGCTREAAPEPAVAKSARCMVETAFLCEDGTCEPYEEAARIAYDPATSTVEVCSDTVGTCARSAVRFERVDAATGAARFYRVITTEEGTLTIAETGDPPALGSFTYAGARLRSLYVLMGQCR